MELGHKLNIVSKAVLSERKLVILCTSSQMCTPGAPGVSLFLMSNPTFQRVYEDAAAQTAHPPTSSSPRHVGVVAQEEKGGSCILLTNCNSTFQ